jgi:hypothetical protein
MSHAKPTLMTNENFVISPEMIDEDQGREPFLSAGSLKEGVSGVKKIDTMYENTSQDYVDNPREGSTPTPDCLTGPMYPHRDL